MTDVEGDQANPETATKARGRLIRAFCASRLLDLMPNRSSNR
jgi:hypothetical protein